jgi:hypothetical protein
VGRRNTRTKSNGYSCATRNRRLLATNADSCAYQKIHDEYFWSLPQPAPDKKEDTNEGKK